MTARTIKCYVPKTKNENFLGEWIFVQGPLSYGMYAPKNNKKLIITNEINPNNVVLEFNDEIKLSEVPKRVLELLQKKVQEDIDKIDYMVSVAIENKKIMNTFNIMADARMEKASDELSELEEYTKEDLENDRKIQQMMMQNQQVEHNKRIAKSQGKAKSNRGRRGAAVNKKKKRTKSWRRGK